MSYEFYEFNRGEYSKRLNKLKKILFDNKIDFAILTDENNIRWISGYWVFTMQDPSMPTAVIIPSSKNKDPILVLPSEGTGESLSWISEIRYWDRGSEDYISINKGKILLDIINESNLKKDRIGIEAGNGMLVNLELNDIDYFRDNLKDSIFVDISNVLWEVRSIKSNKEIDKLRKASEITYKSLTKGFEFLKEDITERKLGQYIIKEFFNNGATGISHVGVSFVDNALEYAHCDPKDYSLKKGIVAKVDVGCSFEGYKCDMYRMACIGKPKKKEEIVASTIKQAVESMIKVIKEGIKCSDLYRIAKQIFIDNGIGYLLAETAYIGHGIGLGIHELPYINKSNDYTLKSGMVLAIEPWTLDNSDPLKCMNIEDIVLVKKNSCEVLTNINREIFLI